MAYGNSSLFNTHEDMKRFKRCQKGIGELGEKE